MDLSKTKLHTKFEVVSFSRYKNIKGEPQNFKEFSQPLTTPSFSFEWDFVMGLGKAHIKDNLEVAIFDCCRNIKGNPKFWGGHLA